MDPLPTPVFVYLDNSNIFLSTQSYSAKINKYKDGIMDVQCRLNVSKLLDIVLNGRIVTLKKAYGHMSKEVKHELNKAGFTVFLSDSAHGEKEVDTQLTTDAVEDIVKHHFRTQGYLKEGPKGTLILLSGDKDMRPLVKLARKYEWNAEVWAYSYALAGALRIEIELKEYGSSIELKLLDKCFQEFGFYDDKVAEIHRERTVLIRFRDKGASLEGMDAPTMELLRKLVQVSAKSTFHLPLATKVTKVGNRGEVAIAVMIVLEERTGKKHLYSFQTDVIQKLAEFERDLRDAIRLHFGNTDAAVFIRNLDTSLDRKDIYDTFSTFGTVMDCRVETDGSGISKEGVVHYRKVESVKAAVTKANGMVLCNKKITVTRSNISKIWIPEMFLSRFTEELKNPTQLGTEQRNAAQSHVVSSNSLSGRVALSQDSPIKYCKRSRCDRSKCNRSHAKQ